MSGILSTFTISLLTKRRFLININSPCPLHDYLIPAHFEWRYNSSILTNRTSSYQDLTLDRSAKIRSYLSGISNINKYFKRDVNFVRVNWDFTEEFRKRPHIGCEIPWITKLQYADMYKQLYNFLFKPSPFLVRALNDFDRTQRTRHKIACAHVRFGGNINMPFDYKRVKLPLGMLWNYFDNLDKEEYDFFVASDTNGVKHLAKQRYPGNMIDTPGQITHIDQPSLNNQREGFMKQLLDFYTLVRCDILIITSSGFGMLAAYIREVDTGLYCWIGRDIRPCSRYTIHNTFPGEMLAPGS
ncbi:uncharacterized protein LOC110443817 [Mizuhopecten yessoensis]|uniref:L-Fucosyltransferase n=1 Tax=Mizuhopecten yessoensis TaxID=6573 RepID=A0A210PE23_MIZYE|nr:uncharacterized protein LOC110443817 [Mizuhopecten yessoensis]OWF34745.1 hypothetical protein KP79_PYT14142 [Mizuhopecten yessoensis]